MDQNIKNLLLLHSYQLDLAIHRPYIYKVAFSGSAMTRLNTIDRSKVVTKRYILTSKIGIPLSIVISSASTHDLNLVTDVGDKIVIHKLSPSFKTKTKRGRRNLCYICLDKHIILSLRNKS